MGCDVKRAFVPPMLRMHGEGHMDGGDQRHHFEFGVLERPNGSDRGRVECRVQEVKSGHRKQNHFVSIAITAEGTFSRAG